MKPLNLKEIPRFLTAVVLVASPVVNGMRTGREGVDLTGLTQTSAKGEIKDLKPIDARRGRARKN